MHHKSIQAKYDPINWSRVYQHSLIRQNLASFSMQGYTTKTSHEVLYRH